MRNDHEFHRLAATAALQHGVASRRQAREIGLHREAVRHRVGRGQIEAVGPRVLRFPSAVHTWKQDLMVAVLDGGVTAAVAFEAGAALMGLPGFWPGPVDVSRQRGRQRGLPVLGELHESRYLPPSHVTVVDGIPVTRLARILFDLAGAPGMHPERLRRTINNAITRAPAVLPSMHEMLEELGRRGRPGIALMREMLAERPIGYIPPASGLETKALDLIAEEGIRVRRQVNVGSHEEWLGRVDAKVEDLPLLVEIDSIIHHSSPMDIARDEARDAAMAAAGLQVVRVFDIEVFTRPWVVGPKVRAAVEAVKRGEPVAKSGAPAPLFLPNWGQGPLLPGRRRYAS